MKQCIQWVTVSVACVVFSNTYASLYMEEGFDFPTGTLAGNGLWTNSSSLITVSSGSLSYSGLMDTSPQGNKARVGTTSTAPAIATDRPFDTTASGGSVFCSFLLNFNTTGGNYYFLGMLPSSVGAPGGGPTDPCDLVYQTVSTSGGTYRLGIRGLGKSTTYDTATTLNLNTPNLVVLKYDFSDGRASLFINPATGGSEPASPNVSSIGTSTVSDLSHFYLRMSGNNAAVFAVDNIRVGQSWTEVTPVPEPGVMAFLGLGFLSFAFHRRSR